MTRPTHNRIWSCPDGLWEEEDDACRAAEDKARHSNPARAATTQTYEVHRPRDPLMAALGADVVLVEEPGRRMNPVVKEPGNKSAGAKRRQWKHDETTIYAGYDHLLVRTAIIRPPNYKPTDQPVIRSHEDVAKLVAHLAYADQEHMVVLMVLSLNTQNRVMAIHEAAIGSATGATFQIRDVCKTVVLTAGVGAVMVHNHPGGDPNPSAEDVRVTRKVAEALDCAGISLIDHVIIAQGGAHYSFRSNGLL